MPPRGIVLRFTSRRVAIAASACLNARAARARVSRHGHPVLPARDSRNHPHGADGESRYPHDHDGHQPARLRRRRSREGGRKAYDKICRLAARLVAAGDEIEREYGIPIINKRISVTPVALVAEASASDDYVAFARAARARRGRGRRELHRRVLGARAQGRDARRRRADRVDPRGAERYGARLRVGQRRHDACRHQHGRGRAHGRGDLAKPLGSRRTATASAARSSSCSATRSRTTRSWPARFTASASPSASSTSA